MFKFFGMYVNLIVQTIIDVKEFLVCFFIIIFSFGNGILILDYNMEGYDYDWDAHPEVPNVDPAVTAGGQVIDDTTPIRFLNAVLNQYLLALGDFDTDKFGGNTYYNLMWFIFMLGTFVIIITFLNMVLAIMGNTFETVSGNWNQASLIERTNIYNDFFDLITVDVNFSKNKYLYVVDSENAEDEEQDEAVEENFEESESFKMADAVHGDVNKLKEQVKNMHLMMIKQRK